MKPGNRSAFTLLELLVVTAILVVLFGLTVGGVVRGKMAAQRIACMSNLKQWGQATHLFTDENEDRLPRESAVDGINTWEMTAFPTNSGVWYNALADTMRVVTLAQYAQTPSSQQEFYSRGNVFHCPRSQFSAVSATYPNFSLAMNSKLMRDFEGNIGPGDWNASSGDLRITQIKVPERTALFLEGGVPGEEQLCHFQAPYTGQPKAYASQFPGRHRSAGNILFVAGHVATLPGKDVVDMNPSSAHRGGGIYPPTEVIWRHDPALVP